MLVFICGSNLHILKRKMKMKLKYIPSIFRTYRICSAMVERKSSNINDVPDRHLDERMMERALSGSYKALYGISKIKKTEYIINKEERLLLNEIEQKHSWAFDHAPEYLETEQVLIKQKGLAHEIAVRNKAIELKREMCLMAIKQPSPSIQYVEPYDLEAAEEINTLRPVDPYDLETAEELIKEGK